jgi:RNA polymerase sigma-70 factor (ECF subfamily)
VGATNETAWAGAGGNEVVSAAARGDAAALESLLREHHARVHALCRRLTGNEEDALDATQEALIAIARGVRRFDGRSSFSTWVYRVATNAALDELRRRRRRPLPAPDPWEGGSQDAPLRAAPDPAGAVAARLDVDRLLGLLPADQRAAVVLRDLLDLDYSEIAETLEIPIGTVRSRIARGRAAMAIAMRRDDLASEPASTGNHPPPSSRQNSDPDMRTR